MSFHFCFADLFPREASTGSSQEVPISEFRTSATCGFYGEGCCKDISPTLFPFHDTQCRGAIAVLFRRRSSIFARCTSRCPAWSLLLGATDRWHIRCASAKSRRIAAPSVYTRPFTELLSLQAANASCARMLWYSLASGGVGQNFCSRQMKIAGSSKQQRICSDT